MYVCMYVIYIYIYISYIYIYRCRVTNKALALIQNALPHPSQERRSLQVGCQLLDKVKGEGSHDIAMQDLGIGIQTSGVWGIEYSII